MESSILSGVTRQKERELMFKLFDKDGNAILMKNGKPFVYTSRSLAHLGKRLLEGERKESFVVVAV